MAFEQSLIACFEFNDFQMGCVHVRKYFNHFHSVIKSINHETYHGSDTDKYCFELTYKSGIIDSITERRGKIKIGNLEYDEQCRITSFLIGGNQVEVTYDSNKHVIKKRFNDTNTTVEYDEYGNSITCFLNDFGNSTIFLD